MIYDPNYDRSIPDGESASIGDIKYKDNYEVYPNELDGTPLDAEVLLAQNMVEERENKKNGGKYKRENLVVVFKVKEKYWLRLKIKGAYLNADGTPKRNPLKLHDFLCIAERQHKNCLADGVEHQFDNGSVAIGLPHLAGMKFKIVVATVSEYMGYDVNEFEFFDTNGLSAVELELGKAKEFSDLQTAIEKLKTQHQQFKAESGITYNAVAPAAQPLPKEPPFNADDIPF